MGDTEFRTFDWNGPKKVQTPNIENDIEQYLGENILEKWKSSSSEELKQKIIIVAERLDFISHLKSIAMLIRSRSKITSMPIGENIFQVNFQCVFQGHDFGGMQFDIEALDYYLRLSCIDAIQSQPSYVPALDWLNQNIDDYANKTQAELSTLLERDKLRYSEEYGLSKNFAKAFTEDISEELKEKICEVLIVVKAKDGEITEESINAWGARDKSQKLKKIASKLYELRSQYTHTNIRSFLPVTDIATIPNLNGEVLLCKKCNPMDLLLNDVIINLCDKKLEN